MNLLLWGAETWSLRKSQLDQLEVFLHRSIQRIVQISMYKVQEDRIQNEKVRKMFYSILCVQNTIAARQADFIGKMIRGPPNQPSRNMITACCDHKRRVGRPQTTGKIFMVENLRLLFQDVTTVNIDRFGSLRVWIHEASHEEYWNQLVTRLLNPCTPIPERPEAWGPLPSWRSRRDTNSRRPTDNSDDDNVEHENDDSHNDRHDNDDESRERQQTPPITTKNPPRMSQGPTAPLLPPNMNQNDGSMTPIFANKSDAACSILSRIWGLGSERLRLK
jgi:hypothetical protein